MSFTTGSDAVSAGIEIVHEPAATGVDRERLDLFLAVLAHEMRTPLTAATAGLQLLRHPRMGQQARAEVLEMIGHRLQRLNELCAGVFDTAAMALDPPAPSMSEVSLADCVERLLDSKSDDRLQAGNGGSNVVLSEPAQIDQLLDTVADFALLQCVGLVDVTTRQDGEWARVEFSGVAREALEPADLATWFEDYGYTFSAGSALLLYVIRTLSRLLGGIPGAAMARDPDDPARRHLRIWLRLPAAAA